MMRRIAGAALAATAVACAMPAGALAQSAWTAPVTLAPGAAAIDRSAPVAANAGGTAAVAGTAGPRGNRRVLRIRERRGATGAWTRSPRIALPATAGDPAAVAVNARGDAVVLLAPRAQPGPLLAASRRGVRGPWRVRAVAGGLAPSTVARLGLDGSGRSTVAWITHRPGMPFAIRVARGAAGRAAWRISRDVLRVPETLAVSTVVATPSIALNARGQLLVGWRETGGTGMRVMSALRPSSGPWRPAEEVSGGAPGGVSPSIALSPGGSRAAAWAGTPGTVTPLSAAVRPREGASWPAATTLGTSDAGPGGLALGDGGDAVVAWLTGNETDGRLRVNAVARRPDGSWGASSPLYARDITPGDPVFVGAWSTGVGRDGRAYVLVTEGERTSTGRTLAAVAARGTDGWAVEEIADSDWSMLAVGDDGSAVVAWSYGGDPSGPIRVRTHPAAPAGGPAQG
jgi:hypothetical protein